MLTTTQIGQQGEQCVVQWLQANGYTTNWNTRLPGSVDIEARGAEYLLVQVKSAILPDKPATISDEEIRNIKARAARLGATAYWAQVQLNSSLQQVGDIIWRKL